MIEPDRELTGLFNLKSEIESVDYSEKIKIDDRLDADFETARTNIKEVLDHSSKILEDVIETDKRLDEDFEKSRENIKNVLDHSSKILEDIIELSHITDSPRAFEATSSLITAITGASKDLLELHEKYNKLKNQEKQTEQTITNQTNIQNNVVFRGSTRELLELIKNN